MLVKKHKISDDDGFLTCRLLPSNSQVHFVRMKATLRLVPKRITPTSHFQNPIFTFASSSQAQPNHKPAHSSIKPFSTTAKRRKDDSATKQAKALNEKGVQDQEESFNSQIDNAIGEAKELQARTPWHREGSDRPPVKRMRSAGAMTKGIRSLALFPI